MEGNGHGARVRDRSEWPEESFLSVAAALGARRVDGLAACIPFYLARRVLLRRQFFLVALRPAEGNISPLHGS